MPGKCGSAVPSISPTSEYSYSYECQFQCSRQFLLVQMFDYGYCWLGGDEATQRHVHHHACIRQANQCWRWRVSWRQP
eukprot:scaffold407503_cov11-Prasinocladus_malaysianus.AAC.1